MMLKDNFERLIAYEKRYGLWKTMSRFGLAFKRFLRGSCLVLYYADLDTIQPTSMTCLSQIRVERKRAKNELGPADLQKIRSISNPHTVQRQLSERFERGATLWLCKLDEQLVGYGWTIIGCTIEAHFFPLGRADAHLFDFFVFPECRGRQFNAALVTHILITLAAEGNRRAFIEAAEWNSPQLQSLSRMPFQRLGCARKVRLWRRLFVVWKIKPMTQEFGLESKCTNPVKV